MSSGSPVVTVRIPAQLLEELGRAVLDHQRRASGVPHTQSSLIVQMIREGLAKRARSRTWRKRKASPA